MTTPFDKITDKTARIVSYYQQHEEAQLEAVAAGEEDHIEIDCTVLREHDEGLYRFVENYYAGDEAGMWFREAAENYPQDSSDNAGEYGIQQYDPDGSWDVPTTLPVQFRNVPEDSRVDIGEPQTDDLGKLVSIRGVVRQVSAPKTLTKKAVWECQRCGVQHTVRVEIGDMKKPNECEACEVKSVPWRRLPDQEDRVDYQEIKLQEEPGEAVDQSNPRTMTVRVEGTELTDVAQPGERVEISGLLQEDMSDQMAVIIDSYVQAVDIETEREDYESLEISEEEAEHFEAMAARMDVEELCVGSLAPDVYGEEMAKRAIVYQLFGGVTHYADSRERSTKAGQIHLAFIGDPGTTKSTLAAAARRVSPRSVKAVGKGMTAAGMTASAVQREIAGSQEWTLEAGALVLGDKGLVTIDELDKANEEVQKALHEALSDQEVSVSKASINVSLPTRVSALMIANPKYGRFDEFEAVTDQFDLDSALLDRADMTLSFVDEPDESLDAKIARQNLSYGMTGDGSGGVADTVGAVDLTDDGLLTTESFRRYVAYAKRTYDPVMTEDARDKLEDFYVSIRSLSSDGDVSLSARAIDSLRKFAEARARMQLREEITLSDADAVVEMYMEMYRDMGVDPESGVFSATRSEGTSGASSREQARDAIRAAIDDLADPSAGDFPARDVIVGAVESEEDVGYVIDRMLDSGDLYQPASDTLATTSH